MDAQTDAVLAELARQTEALAMLPNVDKVCTIPTALGEVLLATVPEAECTMT